MKREPVGIYFANTAAICDMDADPEKRICMIPLLMKVSEGRIISMDEKSCNCTGGATGCCFSDGGIPVSGNCFLRDMVKIHHRKCLRL